VGKGLEQYQVISVYKFSVIYIAQNRLYLFAGLPLYFLAFLAIVIDEASGYFGSIIVEAAHYFATLETTLYFINADSEQTHPRFLERFTRTSVQVDFACYF
jgi:hypothetical protein